MEVMEIKFFKENKKIKNFKQEFDKILSVVDQQPCEKVVKNVVER